MRALLICSSLFVASIASAQDHVLVPVRTIYPGETIAASDLRMVAVAAGRERRHGVMRSRENGNGKDATATH